MIDNVVAFSKTSAVAKKAIILARVSSKEQEDGYSIDAQTNRLQSYCERKNLTVLKTFELVESSTRGERISFMAMIGFIKSQKDTIAIVADKVDRVQRSFKEYPLLDALIQEGKIELHFNTENYIIHRNSVSQERLNWSMGVIMAQSYIENMKDNVKRSFEQKIRQGECVGLAPLGYRNVKDDRGRGDVIIDADRALLIKKIFETYATGNYTLEDVVKKTISWGLRNRNKKNNYLSKSQLHKIINNPFYHGKMCIKGHLYSHRYQPIISYELFKQCQAVLSGWQKKPLFPSKNDFVFRGLLTCATSGTVISAERHSKTYASGKTAQWTYLRCFDPANPNKRMWIREEVVFDQVSAILKKMHIAPQDMIEIGGVIKSVMHSEKEFIHRQLDELKRENKSIKIKIEKLTDLLIDGAMERKDFDDRKNKLRIQQENIEVLITAHERQDDQFNKCLLALLGLGSDAYKLFIGSTTEEKRLILSLVFANLSLKGDKLMYSLRNPFDKVYNFSTSRKWRDLIDVLRSDLKIRHEIITFCEIHNIVERFGVLPCSE